MDFLKQAEGAVEGGGGQDILKEAEGLVGGKQQQQSTPDQSSSGSSQTSSTAGSTGTQKTDYKEVYGSAQSLFQGIQDKMAGKNDVTDAQLAGNADDILNAAKNAGLDKNPQYGQYLDKASDYLAKYKQQGGNTGTGTGTGTGTDTKTDSTTGGTDAPKPSS